MKLWLGDSHVRVAPVHKLGADQSLQAIEKQAGSNISNFCKPCSAPTSPTAL